MLRRFGPGIAVLAATLLALVVLVAGAAGAPARPLRIALVLEPTAPDDPFHAGAIRGLKRAVRELHVSARIFTLTPREDWAQRFKAVAAQRYDLVVGLGSFEAKAIDAAAVATPDAKFALIDASNASLKHSPKNVAGLIFRDNEAGYLAGALAALVEHDRPGKDVISAVGGLRVPSVQRLIAGYRAGAAKAVRGTTVLTGYSRSFGDPAKCRTVASAQIAKGSGVVFDVAGPCGLGALAVAKEKGVWGLGVDIDLSYLGPHILTSAVKRLDVAVFSTIRELTRGRFAGGRDTVFSVRNNGVGLGKISPKVPRALVRRVERIRAQIASGAIVVPRQ